MRVSRAADEQCVESLSTIVNKKRRGNIEIVEIEEKRDRDMRLTNAWAALWCCKQETPSYNHSNDNRVIVC